MERDYGKEIDEINVGLREIKDILAEIIKSPREPKQRTDGQPLKFIEPMRHMHPDSRLSEMMEELCVKADEESNTGLITYLGVYSSGNHQSNWINNQVNTDNLLELIESNVASKVLACIGNNDRLNMLLALLRAPRTVAQLVEECDYNTTGQVYHHLRPLLATNLVKEDDNNRGNYMIPPHRISGIIMLLAGINDLVDTKYSQGDWE